MLPIILRIAASNALTAVLLAAVVAGVDRLVARPALARALWVLVLLKLLTPPLWTISVDGVLGQQQNASIARPAPAVREDGCGSAADFDSVSQTRTENAAGDGEWRANSVTGDEPAAGQIASNRTVLDLIPSAEWIAAAWGFGTLCCLLALVTRVRQFLRSLRLAARAPADVQQRCSMLASRLGLRRVPEVWFGPTSFCPSLWAFSRPARVLVPHPLWDRLELAQQDALLVHELAHLRRRDHWVRLLEVAATIVYWWHPVVWFARRRLHEAEEQCCDAWVLAVLPSAGKSYAAALLETVDFISTAHPAKPALASGLGEFSRLKRRIVMIQNESVRKTLTWTGAMFVFGLAGVVLPVAPGFGQDGPEKADLKRDLTADPTSDPRASQGYSAGIGLKLDLAADPTSDHSKEIMQARIEIQQLSAEMQKIQATLAQAKARLQALEGAQGTGGTASNVDREALQKLGAYYAYIERRDSLSRSDRLERLERQVNLILAEIKEMKGEQHDPKAR